MGEPGPAAGDSQRAPLIPWWRRRRNHAVATAIVLAAAVSVLVAISSSGGSGLPPGVEAAGDAVTVDVNKGEPLAAGAGDTVLVSAPADAVTRAGSVVITPVTAASPPAKVGDVPIEAVGAGAHVDYRGATPLGPVTITFPPARAAEGDTLVAVAIAADGTWSLLAGAVDSAAGFSATADGISTVLWATVDLETLVDALRNIGATPIATPRCGSAPGWVSVEPAPPGVLMCTGRATEADGTELAEVEIGSSRMEYLWVQVTEGPAPEYVAVQSQPDVVRKAAAHMFAEPSAALVPPGAHVTVAYRQPPETARATITTRTDRRSEFMTTARRYVDAATQEPGEELRHLLVLRCAAALGLDLTAAEAPARPTEDISLQLGQCITEQLDAFAAADGTALAAASELYGPFASPETLATLHLSAHPTDHARLLAALLHLGAYAARGIVTATSATTTTDPAVAGAVAVTLTAKAPVSPHGQCDSGLLERAWNAEFGGGYGYTVSDVRCGTDIAVGFVEERRPDSAGDPDFGEALFVWRDGRWVPLGRQHTPTGWEGWIELGATPAQAKRADSLLKGGGA